MVKDNAPNYYDENISMAAIYGAQERLLQELTEKVDQTALNQFIFSADEVTVSAWEELAGVDQAYADLEERRRLLISSIYGKPKASYSTLEEDSRAITGLENKFSITDNILLIEFLGGLTDAELRRHTRYIKVLIPAHLEMQYIFTAPTEIYVSDRTRGFLYRHQSTGEDSLSGEYPLQAYQADINESGATITAKSERNIFRSRLTGTRPDVNIKTDFNQGEFNQRLQTSFHKVVYTLAGENEF